MEDLTKEELLSLIATELGAWKKISPRTIAQVRWLRLNTEAAELRAKSIALGNARKWKESGVLWKQAEAKQAQADNVLSKYMHG
ncbi:MAG: hypothetical protein OT477_16005 [Chloroflexi bacterium]|nr:hypothetical protein [Chloroflexota bacterium]